MSDIGRQQASAKLVTPHKFQLPAVACAQWRTHLAFALRDEKERDGFERNQKREPAAPIVASELPRSPCRRCTPHSNIEGTATIFQDTRREVRRPDSAGRRHGRCPKSLLGLIVSASALRSRIPRRYR